MDSSHHPRSRGPRASPPAFLAGALLILLSACATAAPGSPGGDAAAAAGPEPAPGVQPDTIAVEPAAPIAGCEDPRYQELRRRGPREVSRADSLFVARMELACVYGRTLPDAAGPERDTIALADTGAVRPGVTVPVRRVEVEREEEPAAPPGTAERVAGWTILGMMGWLLVHLVGIL